jgi:hypothetical protein
MAICDSQSFPEFTKKCEPNTDENIFDDADPDSQRFIGKHPGTAFLEMQFYPPGWIGSPQLIDPQNYFAAMVIWSFSQSGATGLFNNKACLDELGSAETPNFAVITKNGVPLQPANPAGSPFGQSNFDLNNVLPMAPGDTLLVLIHDTEDGLEVSIRDLSSGDSGHMTATHKKRFRPGAIPAARKELQYRALRFSSDVLYFLRAHSGTMGSPFLQHRLLR